MPFLNMKYSFMLYEDEVTCNNPDVKIPDITIKIDGIPVGNNRSDSGVVYPNQIRDISTTSRAISWDVTTELSFIRHLASAGSSLVRLYRSDGTNPNFRLNRYIGGGSDTIVQIERVSDYVCRISNIGGTAWNLSGVMVNDYIKFDVSNDLYTSEFSAQNQGQEFLIIAKYADYIDFVDNGMCADEVNLELGADYTQSLKVLSQGPVVVGDIIKISGPTVNPTNHGKFEITDVSDNYIEFVNPIAIAESFYYSYGAVVVYEFLVGFMHLRASASFKMRFDDNEEWMSVGMLGNQAIFFGSVSTHKIQIFNDNPGPVNFSVQTAKIN